MERGAGGGEHTAEGPTAWAITHAMEHVVILKECVFDLIVRARVNDDKRLPLGKSQEWMPGSRRRSGSRWPLMPSVTSIRPWMHFWNTRQSSDYRT